MYIYKITNKINNKIYIGQTTKTIEQRFEKHWKEALYQAEGNRPENYFHNALLKYGKENFYIELLEECSSLEQLNDREIYWIDFYNSTNHDIGYNLMPGGKSGVKSEETKQKISAKKKENWQDPIIAEKMKKGLVKATKAWQEKCEAQRIKIICQCCGEPFFVPPYESNRKYCSLQCANKVNAKKASQVATKQKKEKTAQRNKEFQKDIVEWVSSNQSLVQNCPSNKISTTLQGIQEIASSKYGFSDWRSIGIALCNNPSKKKLLEYLKEISENIC